MEDKQTVDNSAAGIQSETNDEFDKVSAARQRLKAENDAFEAEKLRAEKLRAEAILGGKSIAAQPPKVEESPKDYAKRVLSGKI